MLMSFILLLVLWIGGEAIGLTATHTALIGLSTLLISGVLTWYASSITTTTTSMDG